MTTNKKFVLKKQNSIFDGIILKESANKRIIGRILRSNIINHLAAHYTSAEMYANLKTQLAAYYTGIKDNIFLVEYKMASYGYGRVYPKQSLSLCSIRREVRHAIVSHTGEDTYVDVDISCAHHEILLQLVNYFKNDYLTQDDLDESEYKLKQTLEEFPLKLTDYVNNRNSWLKKVMDEYKVSRDDAKKLFIIILYNGGFNTWAKELALTKKETEWLAEFRYEFKFVCEWMMSRINKTWFDSMVKNHSKKAKKGEDKNPNDIGRFMSIYLQEWERRCLEQMYKYGVREGLIKDSNTVLCYDGIMLEKKDWDEKHLEGMEKEIEKNVGFKLKLECKSFDQGKEVLEQSIIPDPTEDQQMRFVPSYFKSLELYDDQKDYFERFICKVRDQAGYFQIHKNKEMIEKKNKPLQETTTIFHKDLTAFKQYSTLLFKVYKDKETEKYHCEEESTKFIKLWEFDDNLKSYQTIDFIPKNATETQIRLEKINQKEDEDVFNMFCGYNDILHKTALPLKEDGTVNKEKVYKITSLWRDIVLNLCEGNPKYYNFYINYLSQHLKDPSNKTLGLAVIFEGLQGAGKNLHLQPIRDIVGKRYFLETANIDDILGKHAEGYLNKLWVVMNELEGKDSIDFEGQLKSFITEDTKTVNVKFQRPVDVNNYCNLIITTNKKNCIRIDVITGNRRWCAFRCTEKYSHRNQFFTKPQWEQIAKYFESPQFLRCLYYYLTEMIDPTNYNFKIPQTEALKTLIRHSRAGYFYWLGDFLRQKQSFINEHAKFNDKASVLYNDYKSWCEQTSAEHTLSSQKFKNHIHDLGIGIDFFEDTSLNQDRVVFEYKTVLENFNRMHNNNKYEETQSEAKNKLVFATY